MIIQALREKAGTTSSPLPRPDRTEISSSTAPRAPISLGGGGSGGGESSMGGAWVGHAHQLCFFFLSRSRGRRQMYFVADYDTVCAIMTARALGIFAALPGFSLLFFSFLSTSPCGVFFVYTYSLANSPPPRPRFFLTTPRSVTFFTPRAAVYIYTRENLFLCAGGRLWI